MRVYTFIYYERFWCKYIAVYVDDPIIACTDLDTIKDFKLHVAEH